MKYRFQVSYLKIKSENILRFKIYVYFNDRLITQIPYEGCIKNLDTLNTKINIIEERKMTCDCTLPVPIRNNITQYSHHIHIKGSELFFYVSEKEAISQTKTDIIFKLCFNNAKGQKLHSTLYRESKAHDLFSKNLENRKSFTDYMTTNIPRALHKSTLTEHEKLHFLKTYKTNSDCEDLFYHHLQEKVKISENITQSIKQHIIPKIQAILNE